LPRLPRSGTIGEAVTQTSVAILAAGRGTRLSPLTDGRPKCLLPVGQTSPLAMALETLDREPAVAEVILVVGHARETIERYLDRAAFHFPVRQIFNPLYDSANNIQSARVLAGHCPRGFLLLNSDVLCDPGIMREALADPEESFLVVDPTRPPRAEAMKVKMAAGRLAAIGKHLDASTADGEYVGIARFDMGGASAFFGSIDAILERGGSDEWYESAIAEAARHVPFRLRSTGEQPWIEIDDHEDLQRAAREILPRILERRSAVTESHGV
jgi:choline kinase